MATEQLKIIFRHGSLSAELALQTIQVVLARHDVPLNAFTLYDEPTSLPAVLPQLERTGRKAFNLMGQGFRFLHGSVGNYHLDFFEIESAVAPSISWDEWVAEFTSNHNFVMAWVVDSEYDHWQNAKDPLQYTATGKSCTHLPMNSNGLPYPMERKVIEISANPGRWNFRDGYIEVVGATMWLGIPFWALTGTDQKQVAGAPWLHVSHPISSVTKIQAAESCFTMAEGTSGDLQVKLRALLFPVQIPYLPMRQEHPVALR